MEAPRCRNGCRGCWGALGTLGGLAAGAYAWWVKVAEQRRAREERAQDRVSKSYKRLFEEAEQNHKRTFEELEAKLEKAQTGFQALLEENIRCRENTARLEERVSNLERQERERSEREQHE